MSKNMKGVDLSIYQRGISFTYLKKNGYQFAILRGGYTTNGGVRNRRVDLEFSHFYDKCQKYGLYAGCYYYSCAQNYTEGKQDAIFLYENCLKGRLFEMPIYIDVEDAYMIRAGRRFATDAVKGFCETLESLGYYVGLYTGYYIYNDSLLASELNRYSLWGAWWTDTKAPPKKLKELPNFQLWQNSGGTIKVGSYAVDTDISYVDFPKVIRENELNGWKEILENEFHSEIVEKTERF